MITAVSPARPNGPPQCLPETRNFIGALLRFLPTVNNPWNLATARRGRAINSAILSAPSAIGQSGHDFRPIAPKRVVSACSPNGIDFGPLSANGYKTGAIGASIMPQVL